MASVTGITTWNWLVRPANACGSYRRETSVSGCRMCERSRIMRARPRPRGEREPPIIPRGAKALTVNSSQFPVQNRRFVRIRLRRFGTGNWKLTTSRELVAYFDPGLGDEELLVEADGVAVRHAGDKVLRRHVEALVPDGPAVQELLGPLADLVPQPAEDSCRLAKLRRRNVVL